MNEKWPYTQDSTLQDIFYDETQFVNYTHQPPNNSFKTQLSLKKDKNLYRYVGDDAVDFTGATYISKKVSKYLSSHRSKR